MNCPKCGGETKVIDLAKAPEDIYRKRGCKQCGSTFFTVEYEIEKNCDMWQEWVKYNRAWIRSRNKQKTEDLK